MGSFLELPLAMRPLRVAVLLVFGALLPSYRATAEIIVDDFTDELRIDLPDQNLDYFSNRNVGDLKSTRLITAGGVQTDPNGYLDIDQTRPSALTVQIPNTAHTSSEPSLWINLEYGFVPAQFAGVDLTESGKNNAVILEFDRLVAASSLRQLHISAVQRTRLGTINTSSTYSSAISPIPQSTGPFRAVFPFEDFQLYRGMPIPDFDFTFISEVGVLIELALIDPHLPEQLDFDMVLTKVRIGAIPEPATLVGLVVMGVLAVIRIRRPRDKECHHGEIACRNRPPNNGA